MNDENKSNKSFDNSVIKKLGISQFDNYNFSSIFPSTLQRIIEMQNNSLKAMTSGLTSLETLQKSLEISKMNLSPIISQQSVLTGLVNSLSVLDDLRINIGLTPGLSKLTEMVGIQQKIMGSLFQSLNSIENIFKDYDFTRISKLTGMDSSLLDNFYWVIPFEYNCEKVATLIKYETRTDFEKYILKYFNDNRVKRMLSKIKRNCKEKDKKILLKQVENSYFNGDYAICITSLVTLLDGLTLQLIEPNSDSQHLSYKAINDMLEYMNDRPITEFSYELYLKVDILNNFYAKLYDNEIHFKTTTREDLSRHISSHGVKYLNSKIDVLRLLNTIYFCQQIINETNLQEEFTKDRKMKKFVKISTNLQSTK